MLDEENFAYSLSWAPAGVEGLWPIIEESVITVSVSVSIAVSPMTGAASFRRTKSMSEVSLPIRLIAIFNAFLTECTFSIVPFVPVVGQEALVKMSDCRQGLLLQHIFLL